MKSDEEILVCVQSIVPTMYGGMPPYSVEIVGRPGKTSCYYTVEKDFTPCIVTLFLEEDAQHNLILHHFSWEVSVAFVLCPPQTRSVMDTSIKNRVGGFQ
jgi:hypothetical protein